MLVTLGWLLLAGLPLSRTATIQHDPLLARHSAAGRVSVWTDRDDPYTRGDGARVHLSVDEPSYVAVLRVDTDGRIRVLFPTDPRADAYVRDPRDLEVTGSRGGRSFLIDDDPGIGYLFALASAEPFDFRDLARGDHWDNRPTDGGRIQGDPYVALTDLAARIAPGGDYDYDVAPYYVDRRYDYPRFVCYDCHAYASYSEWDPYRTPCTRYRVVIRDDPRYYPYRYGGRNVVAERLAHPGPRYVFRAADPRQPSVTGPEAERRRDGADDPGRSSLRRRPERLKVPLPGQPAPRKPRAPGRDDSARQVPDGLRPATAAPRSTGEPELRRRPSPPRRPR